MRRIGGPAVDEAAHGLVILCSPKTAYSSIGACVQRSGIRALYEWPTIRTEPLKDASSKAVWGQLRGHRGGGIDLSFVRVADDPAGELWRSPKQRAGGVGTAALTPMTAVDPIFRERRLAGRIRSATRPASKLPETRKHVACHRILSPVSMLKRRECRCGASKGPASSRGL